MSKSIGMILLYIGILFDFLGCIGLIRLPDLYSRLLASAKCVTLGTCTILLGTILMAPSVAAAIQSALCLVFMLITSPTAAHALARGAHRAGVKHWKKSVIDQYAEDKEKNLA